MNKAELVALELLNVSFIARFIASFAAGIIASFAARFIVLTFLRCLNHDVLPHLATAVQRAAAVRFP